MSKFENITVNGRESTYPYTRFTDSKVIFVELNNVQTIMNILYFIPDTVKTFPQLLYIH